MVKIIDNTGSKTVHFKDLKEGDTFKHKGSFWIKTHVPAGNDVVNAYCFTDNLLYYITGLTDCEKVDIEMTVKCKGYDKK